MHQPQIGATPKDILGLLPANLPAQPIFDYIMCQLIKVQAHFRWILTIRRMLRNVFLFTAAAARDTEICVRIEYFFHFFIRQDGLWIFYRTFEGQNAQAFFRHFLKRRHEFRKSMINKICDFHPVICLWPRPAICTPE